MAEQNIQSILDVTLEKVRALADAQTIVGEAIALGDGVTAVPIAKVSVGFASGGSDFAAKSAALPLFGGGGGGGVSITPIAFLVCQNGNVRLLPMHKDSEPLADAVQAIPDLVGQIRDLFAKNKEKKEEKLRKAQQIASAE